MENLFTLTPRENEVKDLMLQGLTNREIAERLIISTHTATAHVRHILHKLGINSRIEILLLEIKNLKSLTQV